MDHSQEPSLNATDPRASDGTLEGNITQTVLYPSRKQDKGGNEGKAVEVDGLL